ncbi:MAG: PTS sugar transporter subunit IIA [Gemmatimonadetes bacterium]|uniref:PTS sugar transporter subunit IIA n=1 Tax=Candidatus Kutchimonas denitrificans TaxID=3056748 RepID=A0AAE4Z9E0_9BACT|nr:PTS sugar transporter subunit IIA [Gemmatimonadota bacterium]NIR76220.1 PTS sugar transporter subunit IIA [Candidatus Kutchimonas denitrificans]NIS00660.1 PTS sugar transporter subunit IIA [Gemmatimonadota bacterium]NIT66805.1 PTS sugar transporter subunit IIA [Gemmatimonadota bacterium]NIV23404.1 PTS transporter subunit EIIA [Gemmatimonadota bacterium]
MKLHHYLQPALVIRDLNSEGVESTLRRMVRNLVEQGQLEDEEPVIDALLEREAAQSTGIGGGVAIPHAVYPALESTVIELALSPGGVDFKALDGEPVQAFFLLLSPPASSSTHIKLLARIARLMKHPNVLNDLLQATTSEQIIERIRQFDELHP